MDRLLTAKVKGRAAELGFAKTGVAEVSLLQPEAERLRHWLMQGRHGTMHYMQQTAEVRADPSHPGMLPGAASVVVLATPYRRPHDPAGPSPGVIAAYARGRDYHNVLYKRARKVARVLREAGHRVRVAVDSMPVFERAWAQRAGLGFIGKNCCLIVPGLGSHVLLSALVTTAELQPDEPMAERCGSCRRCLDGCPTEAFVDARQLDARRCISYWTIESTDPVPEALRKPMGDRLFGCDVCQDVCPYNRTSVPPADQTDAFRTDPRWRRTSTADFLSLDEAAFRERVRGTPLKRPGTAGMARNAAIVLGNSKDPRHLPVLQATAREHADPVVREAASWAAKQIDTSGNAD